jgi:hypothetical protein
MSYDADLINAYRDQLARIRAAWKALYPLGRDDCDGLNAAAEDVNDAINSTEADDLENLYKPQVSSPVDIRETPVISLSPPPYDFYTWTLDDEDERARGEGNGK